MQASDNKTLAAALDYHRRGWSVIPVPTGTKAARIRWTKHQRERADEAQIRRWFGGGENNIAVVLGPSSNGLACRDFDSVEAYGEWAAKYPDLAAVLPTVKTARGYHVYFDGHLGGVKHFADGEFRGSRCYSLLPPSIHPDGPVYHWLNPLNGELPFVEPELAGFMPMGTDTYAQTDGYRYSQIQSETIREERVGREEVLKGLIQSTLPKREGTRNRRIFDFALAIKSRPEYARADPLLFREAVVEWYRLALPVIRTKDFLTTWFEFLKAWKNITYRKDDAIMTIVLEQAMKIEPPERIAKLYPDSPKLLLLAGVCRELQTAAGDGPFYLGVRTAAKLLDVDPKTAHRYLFLLCAEHFIEEVEKGGGKMNPRKATRYRFLG